MKGLKYIKFTLLFILLIFSINSFSQFSKTHYIPPVPNLNNGATSAQIQYLYISTPNEEEFNVTITPIDGEAETLTVSNSEPIEFFIGNGAETNLIALSESIGQVINNKGYIVEADDLVYVSVKLLASSSYYQALGLVSKGLAGLGKTFRVGTFQNESSEVDMGNSGNNFNFLNFVSVLATQDNTVVNFSDFGNGATIFNDANYENIILNRGESYIIGVQPSVLNVDNTNALIGVLVESNKPIAVNSGSFNGTNAD